MALLPQSDEEEQYDQNEIQNDHYAQEREISLIGFWRCVHVTALTRFLVQDYLTIANSAFIPGDLHLARCPDLNFAQDPSLGQSWHVLVWRTSVIFDVAAFVPKPGV